MSERLGEPRLVAFENTEANDSDTAELIAEVRRLRVQVEAVLKLHQESDSNFSDGPWCRVCENDWPCATVRALEGEP